MIVGLEGSDTRVILDNTQVTHFGFQASRHQRECDRFYCICSRGRQTQQGQHSQGLGGALIQGKSHTCPSQGLLVRSLSDDHLTNNCVLYIKT